MPAAIEGSSPNPLFISYAHEDRDAAEIICAALESRGIPAWIDHRDVPIGANYAATIAQSVRRAPALLVVLSSASVDSVHVQQEVAAAGRRGIPIFVFREDETAVPEEMELYANFIGRYESAPREERSGRFLSELIARLGSSAKTARPRATSTEAASEPGAHDPTARPSIANLARRAAWVTVRACLIGAFVLLGTSLVGDGVTLDEEFTVGELWVPTLEDVDLEEYAGATVTLSCSAAILLCAGIVACMSGWRTAESVRTGQVQAAAASLPSLRHPMRPMVRVRAALTDRERLSSFTIATWWPCLLISAMVKLIFLATLGVSTTPAIVAFSMSAGAHVLAFVGTILFYRVARALHQTAAQADDAAKELMSGEPRPNASLLS